MKFNWISEKEIDGTLRKFCIDLEYRLRPKITRFLMDRVEYECQGDFSSFHFDVYLNSGKIRISRKTPIRLTQKISPEFQREFGSFTYQQTNLAS